MSGRLGLPPMMAAIAATTAGQLPVFLTGALAVQISHDLTLGEGRLGIAVAAFFACSAACSALFGRLADRVGGVRVMRAGLAPAVVALLGIGLGVHRWAVLVAALALAGVANGAVQPAANRYLVRAVRAGRQGLAFGVKQAAIPAATLLAGLAVPAVAYPVGWRWAFVGAAGLAALVAALVRRPSPGALPAVAPSQDADRPPRVARRPLVTLAVGAGAASAAANAMGSFFVLSAVSIGVHDARAGLVAAAGSVVSLTVRLLIGVRADRRDAGHLRVVGGLCAAGAVGLLMLAAGQPDLLLPGAIVGYGAGWGWAGLFNFAVTRTHPGAPGRATGLTQVGASAGACLGPLCFGLAAGHFGYPAAWVGGAALLLAAAVIIRRGRAQLYAAGVIPALR